MKKIILISMLLFMGIVHAQTLISVTANNSKVSINEPIEVKITDALGNKVDWVGIYKKGTNNKWKNVVSWKYTNGIKSGNLTLKSIATVGVYEVRLFFKNSYTVEAKHDLWIVDGNNVGNTKITVPGANIRYVNGSDLQVGMAVDFKNMGNNSNDWLGLYPVGTSNDFSNVLGWTWVRNKIDGRVWIPFTNVRKSGDYEIRAFFKNSFTLEGKSLPLHFKNREKAYFRTSLNHTLNQKIKVTFHSVPIDLEKLNWIGIYPKGASNAWENVLDWRWINRGEFAGTKLFKALPLGEYEARLFYNNSYSVEQVKAFTVLDDRLDVVTYAEGICLQGASRNDDNIAVVCNDVHHDGNIEVNVLLKQEKKLLLISNGSVLSEKNLASVPSTATLYGEDNRGPISMYDQETHTSVYSDGSYYDFYFFGTNNINKVLSYPVKANTTVSKIFISQINNDTWQIYLEYKDAQNITYRDTYRARDFIYPYTFVSNIKL